MKLAVIGGGGVRSMFLAKSLASKCIPLGINKIVFMDNDQEKLNIYGKMAKKVANLVEPSLDFSITDDPLEAIKDSDYVITTIRVGGDSTRAKEERIALNYGILGQETTGVAGFSFAIRSVSELAKYCEMVKKYAKAGCKVFNFTNPVGVVSQSLRNLGYDFTYGICDAPSGMLLQFAKHLKANPATADSRCYGLNHLSFFNSITTDGVQRLFDLINDDSAYIHTDLRYFDKEEVKKAGVIPNEYLYYFYNTQKAVDNIIKAGKSRGEFIEYYNKEMLNALKSVDIDNEFEKALGIFESWYGKREASYMANETGVRRLEPWRFDIASPDEGGYAGVALRFIYLERAKKEGNMVLCVPNKNKAIDFLEESDTVEISCLIKEGEYIPYSFKNIAKSEKELITKVKEYERLAASAIIKKDKSLAIKALEKHPLIYPNKIIEPLLDRILELNKPFVGEWA